MSRFAFAKDVTTRMLCQSCGGTGVHTFGDATKPAWCSCRPGKVGPIVMAPGAVVRLVVESTEDAERREQGRLLGNAEREARDRLSERWVRCGRGWRELPRSSPKRRALEVAYREALRALKRFQATCPHPTRSMFAPEFCDVCHACVARRAS